MARSRSVNGMTRKGNKYGVLYCLRRDWQKYVLLIIPMIIVFIFCYIPMSGLLISFQDYNIIKGISGSEWVGMANFQRVFALPRFWRVLRNTLTINILSLLVNFPLPVIFAIMLNEMSRGRIVKTVQTISYLPHFLSTVIIFGLTMQIFGPAPGVINQFLKDMGAGQLPFLTENGWWLFTYLITGVWEGIGWNSIIYIAAIANLNPETYEAATVDGASRFQRIWHVTLPGIKPTMILMFILSIGGIMNIGFEKPYTFGNPLVNDVAEVISVYVYNVGLGNGDFSVATVVGLFQSVVGSAMVLTVNGIAKALGEDGLW